MDKKNEAAVKTLLKFPGCVGVICAQENDEEPFMVAIFPQSKPPFMRKIKFNGIAAST